MPSIADLVDSIPQTVQLCAKKLDQDDAAAAEALLDILSSAISHARTDPGVAAQVLRLLLPELQSAGGRAMLDASVLELLPLAVELGTCSAAAGSLAGQLVAQATAQCPPRDVITALLEAIAVHGSSEEAGGAEDMVTALLAVLPAALARLPRRRLAFTLEALQPALRCAGVRGARLQAWFRALERSADMDQEVLEQLQVQAGETCSTFARLAAELVAQVLQSEMEATARKDLGKAVARFVLSLLSHLTLCWPQPQPRQQYLNAPVQPGCANPSTLSSQQQEAQQQQAENGDSCSAAASSLLRSLAACDIRTWQQLQQLASGSPGSPAGAAHGTTRSGNDSDAEADDNNDSDSDGGNCEEPAVVTGACLAAVYSIAPAGGAGAGSASGPGQGRLLSPPDQPAEVLSLCCQLARPLVDLSAGLQSEALLHKALGFVVAAGKLAQQQRAGGAGARPAAAAAMGSEQLGPGGEMLGTQVWPTLQVLVATMSHSPQEPTRALAYQAACALLAALPGRMQLALLLRVLGQGEPEVCAMMMQRLRALLVSSYAACPPGAASGAMSASLGGAAASAAQHEQQASRELQQGEVVGPAELEQAVVDVAAEWLQPVGRHGWGSSAAAFVANANAISTALNLLRLLAMRYQHKPWLLPLPSTSSAEEACSSAGSGDHGAGRPGHSQTAVSLSDWLGCVCNLAELGRQVQGAQEGLQPGCGQRSEGSEALVGPAGDDNSLGGAWLAVCRVAEVCKWLGELVL